MGKKNEKLLEYSFLIYIYRERERRRRKAENV
jgi:hypothetical protein